jgi:tyrosyl-tRNA synthetase
MQAYDFLELYRRLGCTLQIGGSDQWGNIVAGVDLIRRVEGKAVHALTIPLLTKADGSKFGKTAGGSIWLDPEMTSPYAFYQFFLNSDDRDVITLLKTFSFKSHDELSALFGEHQANPGARSAHRALAHEVTSYIHGEETARKVEEASRALFGQSEIRELDRETLLSAIAELPHVEIAAGEELSLIDAMAGASLVDSKSAARRIIKEGGAYLNNTKVSDEALAIKASDLLHGAVALIRKGKRDLMAVVKKA